MKLIGINNITDIGGMFMDCHNLLSVKDYTNEIGIKNINNLNNFLYEDNSDFSLFEETILNYSNNE